MAQLAGYSKSDFGSEILQIAAGYQNKASDYRLGLPRTQNASLQKTSTSRFKKPAAGISKGKTILAEMQALKEDAGKIKITAGLWVARKGKKAGTDTFVKVTSSMQSSFMVALTLHSGAACF